MNIVRVFKGLHSALGRWYWFILVALFVVSLHTTDHVTAAFTDTSPLGNTIVGEQNVEGFVLWHGGLTILDYSMTVVLLTLLYTRWDEPAVPRGTRNPLRILKKLHRALGRWYWFVAISLIFVSAHTFDHIIAMIFNTSPLSDTFVANSISHEGFIVWHSVLTIVDYAMTVVLLALLYSRWKAAQETQAARISQSTETLASSTMARH
jgi:hypothetical protein